MDHRTIAIIETLILLGLVGALIIFLALKGSSISNVSFITGS